MIIRIPDKKSPRWTGPYLGNYEGLLWRTFNIDLERNPGHISLSMNFRSKSDTSTMANLKVVDAYQRTDADGTDRWWGLNRSGRLFKSDTNNPLALFSATWAEDAITGTPTDAVDMTVHENDTDSSAGNNRLFVTRAADICTLNDTADNTWDTSWWVTRNSQTALQSSVPHPIEYFPYQRISIVGDGNLIHTIDKNEVIAYARLTLPTYLQVWAIFTTPFRAWILCGGLNGHNGAIVEWDGYTQSPNYIHDAQASHALSGVNYSGIPIIINSRGLIMEYNGSSFQPMIRNGQKICFPSYEESSNGFAFPSFTQGNMPVAPRGMTVTEDGLIHIAIQGPFFGSQRHLAGIWCLNPEVGRLYSKYSYTLVGTDYGHQFFLSTGAGIGAIKATGVETGAGSGIATAGYLIGGGKVYTAYTSTLVPEVWLLGRAESGEAERRGYFITQYLQAQEIQEQWDAIWIETTPFRNTTYDTIVVKARGVDPLLDANRLPLEKTITWTSTTTFTVTLQAPDDALAVGDEIEVIAGKNAGMLAHITVISGAYGALQTITIDETGINGSSTSLCRFDRWKKLGVITNSTKYSVPLKIGITSSFIQFKVEMRGFGGRSYQIKSLNISTVEQTKAKK